MENDAQPVRKRILFLSVLLGFMFGVAAYLTYKAIAADKLVLLVVLLPLALTSIPLVRQLQHLRRLEPASREHQP